MAMAGCRGTPPTTFSFALPPPPCRVRVGGMALTRPLSQAALGTQGSARRPLSCLFSLVHACSSRPDTHSCNRAQVLECLSGGELFDRIVSKEKYTEDEARLALQDLARAMAYFHRLGICHRDIKVHARGGRGVGVEAGGRGTCIASNHNTPSSALPSSASRRTYRFHRLCSVPAVPGYPL